ncbi:LPS assembly protein LptD [Coraliomargarita sp. SDUM461004]|uniref:LPS assembly protein LptD n=1 Tax=Thalassobacterium sedimentorum TaxID=3041258 RepID=A0ABU1AJS6_9BACT|nr:LPS assembly protein LptD [Coraliomargarita sp. SDUM461004]MDQ8195046.1 LPS assembly protein LptD [Coraliomargarita sp. SDUM461004]
MLVNARNTSFLFSLTLSISLNAALPELSSLEPLEFDEDAQRLVARGDARLDFDNTRIRADRITYYQDYALADADGNVVISRDGGRLITERLSFDANDSIFSVDYLRTGQWPYYVTGVSAGGTTQNTTVQGATVYYGNPSKFGLSVSSDEIRYVNDENEGEYVSMDGATFRVGSVPVFYLPGYRHYLSSAPYMVDANAGSDGELGYYLQTTTLFPVASWLRAGVNLDYYSQRGVLAGPTAQYAYNSAQQSIVGALSTGAINDTGSDSERDLDSLGNQIESQRGFAEWRHKHHIGERFTATASVSYWSDSEVTRDFRDDIFDDNERPDTFAEAVYAGDNYLLSAFGRFRPNDFQLVQERSPEVRLDILPIPIFNTGAYQRASFSYAQLREDFDQNAPTIGVESEADRFDLTYRIERPILLSDWLTLTPLAGARLTQYDNQQIDNYFRPSALSPLEDSFNREIYELGFDLEARAYASYPTTNKTWDIDGLRHLVRPILRYRYYSDPDDVNEIATIDREVFDLQRPLLDLSDLRNVDQINETHLVRLGVENLFQTRAKGYGSRTLAALNFYQDILFEKELRYDGDEEDTFNATWVELVLTPAPWLKFDLASRFKTETLSLEELRTRTTLKSGEIWEIGLSTDLLNQQIDQYRLDFIYRINERYSFLSDVDFDADTGDFTKIRVGLRTRIGNTWELVYALTFREGAQRESDVEFQIQLSLAGDE